MRVYGARVWLVCRSAAGIPKQGVGPAEVRAEPERPPLGEAAHLATAEAPRKGGGVEHIDDQLPALVHRVRTVAIRAYACRHHLAQLFDGGVGPAAGGMAHLFKLDRKSTRLNSSH